MKLALTTLGAVARETLWALLACALAAVWADFSAMHAFHSGDTLMQPMVSVVAWTPFYWGQDRFGMLVALLAWPVRDPLANLQVQYFLLLVAFLALPPLALRWAGAQSWAIGGTLASAAWLAVVPPSLVFELVANPYSLGLLLMVLALEQAQGPHWGRRLAALCLAAVGAWVHGAIAPLGLLLALARWQVGPAVTMGFGAVAGWGFNRLAGMYATQLNPVPVSQWPHGWEQLALNVFSDLGGPFFLLVGAALGVGLLRAPASERRIALTLLAAAVGYGLLVGTSKHVRAGGYLGRYAAPSLYLIVAAVFGLLMARASPWPRWTRAAQSVVLLGAVALAWGFPSWRTPREVLEKKFGAGLDAARGAGCTHLAGGYWFVWPVQFMSLMRGPTPIWAVSFRSEAQAPLWKTASQKLCAAPGDAEADRWVAEHGLGEVTGRTVENGLEVLQVRPKQ